MNPYVVVALGSALGGAFRHGVNVGMARLLGTAWPWGTFVVNVSGSFAIGAIVGDFALRGYATQTWLLFLTTGILGGYTTFSAFSLDIVLLYERGQLQRAMVYAVASVVVSLVGLVLGLTLIRRVL